MTKMLAGEPEALAELRALARQIEQVESKLEALCDQVREFPVSPVDAMSPVEDLASWKLQHIARTNREDLPLTRTWEGTFPGMADRMERRAEECEAELRRRGELAPGVLAASDDALLIDPEGIVPFTPRLEDSEPTEAELRRAAAETHDPDFDPPGTACEAGRCCREKC